MNTRNDAKYFCNRPNSRKLQPLLSLFLMLRRKLFQKGLQAQRYSILNHVSAGVLSNDRFNILEILTSAHCGRSHKDRRATEAAPPIQYCPVVPFSTWRTTSCEYASGLILSGTRSGCPAIISLILR